MDSDQLYHAIHSVIKDTLNLLLSESSEKTSMRLIDTTIHYISNKIFEHVNEFDKIKDIKNIAYERFFSVITNFFYFLREHGNYPM